MMIPTKLSSQKTTADGKSEFIRKFIIPCKLIQKSSLSPDSENLVVIDKSLDLWILNMNNEKENKISEN